MTKRRKIGTFNSWIKEMMVWEMESELMSLALDSQETLRVKGATPRRNNKITLNLGTTRTG